MKFFSLCLFVLSSVFAVADRPLPEQDRQYLNQERDENGFGCVVWDTIGQGKSIQQSDGTWVDQHPERRCEEYCRPPQSGDEDIIVRCYGSAIIVENGRESGSSLSCTGVADTQTEAISEALSICNYQGRNVCKNRENCNIRISCDPAQVCFDVDHNRDGTIEIDQR